jgi:spermidine synthase
MVQPTQGQAQGRRWYSELETDPDEVYLFAVNKTVLMARTSIQNVEILETPAWGKVLVLDGLVQSASEDEYVYHEALIHPGMLAHLGPREVLVIGGGEGATLREILSHKSVERVTMVDIDGELVEICKNHLPEWHAGSFDDPRTEVLIGDGRAFLENTDRTFDVIVCDITDFLDHGPALRLYTREFYQLIASRLNPDGILVVQALETGCSDPEEHAMLARTIREVFPIVRSYLAFVPSFGFTWGFLTASITVDPGLLTAQEVDQRIADRLDLTPRPPYEEEGDLGFYDGQTHVGMFSLPKDLRAELGMPGEILDDATVESWMTQEAREPEAIIVE